MMFGKEGIYFVYCIEIATLDCITHELPRAFR